MTAATRDFTVARSQNRGHTWTFTPVSPAARQQAIDFGLPDGNGAYAVLDLAAPEALQRLQEEGFGVGFETKHGQELLMEAAVCLWEAILESKDKSPEEPPNWEDRMIEVWEEVGTAHMRQFAIGLAPAILHVYDGIGGANALPELNLIPYDWMFVPSVLAEVECHTSGPVLDPQAAIAALLEKNSPSPDLAPMAAGPGGP